MTTNALTVRPARGLALGFVGGLALSFDIPLIRLAGSDPHFVMGIRGLGIAVVLWLYWRFFADRSDMPKQMLLDRYFVSVAALSGVNNIFFSLAVFNTSTANVVFILAFNALLAAVFSWPLTGERPNRATWGAIAATLVGVTIIVSDGFTGGSGHHFGNSMAFMCAITLAMSLTLARKSGQDLSLAPGLGGVISLGFALPFIIQTQTLPAAPGWLYFDALVLVPIAGITLWLAPRYIPSPHVALFYLLETVLAPLWVWYVFSEVPPANVFVGGTIVVTAITAHALYELRLSRRSPLNG